MKSMAVKMKESMEGSEKNGRGYKNATASTG
jgi:hypothetical protein